MKGLNNTQYQYPYIERPLTIPNANTNGSKTPQYYPIPIPPMLPPHVATSIEECLICFSSWAGNWWNTDQCYDGEEVDAHSNGTHPVHNNTVSPVEEVSHT